MPKSIKKTGYPDGIYSRETVTLFQGDSILPLKDGIAGKNTITLLDKSLTKIINKNI